MRKLKILLIAFVLFLSSFTFTGEAEAAKNIVNPYQTYSYEKMVNDIKRLQKRYPDLIKVKVIGKSEFGRDIYAFSLGKGDATVFINGSHHAREWLTTNLNMYMAEQYAIAYKKKKRIKGYNVRSILNKTTIWFIPMVNPDGVTLQQYGLKKFPKKIHKSLIKMNGGSKNFKRWKANAKGVDLNRQYNAGWKKVKGPSSPSYMNYKGKRPESAAETKAVLKLVKQIKPQMAVSYHSSGRILYWQFKQKGSRYKRDHKHAKKIGKMTGYSLIYRGNNPPGGGFTDWFIATYKKPAFTPEISRYVGPTNPPLSEFKRAWRENQGVGLYVANEGAKLFKQDVKKYEKEYRKLASSAKKLKKYYYSDVKSKSKVKTTKKLNSLYAKVKKELNTLDKKTKYIPKKSKKKINKHRKVINDHLTNASRFKSGNKAGSDLLALNKKVEKTLKKKVSENKKIKQINKLQSTLTKTEKKMNKMYGKRVRKYAKQKYIQPAEKTIKKFVSKYEKQYTNVNKSAKELKTYYYGNIQSPDDLVIPSNFTKLNSKVKKDLKNLDKKTKILSSKLKMTINKRKESINKYTNNADRYVDGVNAGESLLTFNEEIKAQLTQIESEAEKEQLIEELSKKIKETEAKIGKMFGKEVRKHATAKFIAPAKATITEAESQE